MQPRLDPSKVAPGAYKAMLELENHVRGSRLEPALLELARMRASQINGCAYCIDMHSNDARAAGETEQRLDALHAWREAAYYTERERAALAWTEAITLIRDGHAPGLYDEMSKHFAEEELVTLTLAIVAINWVEPPGDRPPAPSGRGYREAP
jgi:AhpD family alkylhydroperoxidase